MKHFHVALLTTLLVAAGVRLARLQTEDLWLDELHSLANSAARRAEFENIEFAAVQHANYGTTTLQPGVGVSEVWRGMRDDSHPPIYFMILNMWRRVFGDAETTIRLPSVLFSVLSLIPFACIFREFGLPRTGIAAALLLALTITHISTGQDTRPYSLAMLFVCMSYWSFAVLLNQPDGQGRNTQRYWCFVHLLTTFLAVMTHYFAAAALAGQVIVMVAKARRAVLGAWLLSVVIATGAFLALWGPTLVAQWTFIANQDWLRTEHEQHLLQSIMRLADLPLRLMFYREPAAPQLWSAVLGAAITVAAMWLIRRQHHPVTKLFLAWYWMPALMFLTIDISMRMELLHHPRYVSVIAPGMIGVMVLAVMTCRPRFMATAALAVGIAIIATIRLPAVAKPRGLLAAQHIVTQWRPGDLLVFDEWRWPSHWAKWSCQMIMYYLESGLTIKPDVLLLNEPPEKELVSRIARYDRLIVLSPRAGIHPNPAPGHFEYLDKTGYVRHLGELCLFVRR